MLNINLRLSIALGILILSSLLTACHTVPVTGRAALSMASEDELIKMSAEAFQSIKNQYPISRNPKYNAIVNKVGQRIADANSWDILNADWEFIVFEDNDRVNAFAMSGGKVGVFSGLFRIVESEEDLAVVIGHELAHVAAKHVNEKLSQEILIRGGAAAAYYSTGGQGYITQKIVLKAYGLGSQLGTFAFTRKKEMEADHIGLIYMARAGYDPRQAIDFWERMNKETEGKPVPPQWLSTHPSHEDRVLLLHKHMPQAVEAFERGSGDSRIQVIQ